MLWTRFSWERVTGEKPKKGGEVFIESSVSLSNRPKRFKLFKAYSLVGFLLVNLERKDDEDEAAIESELETELVVDFG